MRERECQKCGELMQYQEPEPEVGVNGGWFCDACGATEDYEPPDERDYEHDWRG
jgi:hypothetical protein